jgi:choline kinase
MYVGAMAPLPAVYLAAGEGSRLRPLTDDRPKAMLEVGDVSLARRALERLRGAGVSDVVAVTGHCAGAFAEVGDLLSDERFNPCFAQHGNVYSLWCARDVLRGGGYIVNSDVLFGESMKAVAAGGRLRELSKHAPVGPHPEYIGLARVDPAHGELLAAILDGFVERGELDVYYEDALTELAARVPVTCVGVDGLAWIEIDDHDDLARARDVVLARVA